MPTDGENRDLGGHFLRRGITRRDFVVRGCALGLSATGMASALAACSGDEEKGASPPATVKTPTTSPRSDVPYPEGYVGPIASKKGTLTKDPVTLRVVVPQDPFVGDWSKNAFTKWFEQRTNVHIEWKVVAGDDSMTKVNAMIAAGDLPDAFMSIGFSPAQEMLYGSQGLFRPLNKYIDEYGVEIKRVFQDYPDTKRIITSTDKNIYSLPNLNDCFHCSAGAARTWIYQPWLDKLGLGVPQNLQDFEEVLRAFKTKDPNGNGKADEVPFMGYSWEGLDAFIMSSFLYNPGTPWLVLNDGTVEVTFDKPEWREGLRYLNKLYKEGLLPKASFTQDEEALKRVGNAAPAPILGSVRAFYQGSFLTLDDQSPKARWRDYVTVPILKGPDGTRVGPWNYYGAVSTGTFAITKACKNPEIALMWADAQYELEAIIRSNSGVLDEDWRWAKESETGLTGKQAVWTALVEYGSQKLTGRTWNQKGVQYRSNDFRVAQASDPKVPTFEKFLHDFTERDYYAYRQDKAKQLPPLSLNEEQAAQVGELATTINNHVSQMTAKFTIGEVDVNDDNEWNNYLKILDRMGVKNYLAIQQDAYTKKYT
ncbi:extracellular solute-binding protein [Actinopolymorpha alba]|uniref:extracellular solute-binding protein n=1 Tax=Actinopolymorpha alba TaxID=533267 RepID=UPI0003714946|nr:extracellular solute-binding protein [Actinopolymorpha alba]